MYLQQLSSCCSLRPIPPSQVVHPAMHSWSITWGLCELYWGWGSCCRKDLAALAPGVLSVIYFCNAKLKGHFALQRMKLQCTFPVKNFEGSDKNLNTFFPSSPFI